MSDGPNQSSAQSVEPTWVRIGNPAQPWADVVRRQVDLTSPMFAVPLRLIATSGKVQSGIIRSVLPPGHILPNNLSLSPGTRLGVYEIMAQIGAGGMGQVYRARDTSLNRDVALKILPDAFASDPDRLARFTREAQTLASLNHPHIAAIYGIEQSQDVRALVMELVEGEDLSQRIGRGAVPLDEALPIAKQIAEALEAAHEQGIIHRDLKPANIKVRPDGAVKVLDFGLAKAVDPVGSVPNVSESPTLTSPAMMTGVGVILGTAAYMSPEQAKGRPADKRSDIWAFGCVLYEMLTGKRPFDGEDMTEVLGAVVRLEPDWEALSADVPPPVRTLLHRCLVKDRRTRIADVAALLFVLDHHTGLAPASGTTAAPVPRRSRWARGTALTAGAAVIGIAAGSSLWIATRPSLPRVQRFSVASTGTAALRINDEAGRAIAITPDGTRVIYIGIGATQILVRSLDQLEPAAVATSSGLRSVFVSPDGEWVGFVEDSGQILKKVAITGGPIVSVTPMDGAPRGATWAGDTIVFATTSPVTGLQRVPAAGGEPSPLTTPDRERGEGDHLWPEFLPGGTAVLFTIAPAIGSAESGQIAVMDLQTGTSKVLIRGGSDAHYVPTGHLVYGASGTLRAVAFDLARLEVMGTPTSVLEGVWMTKSGAANVAVAANGSLVYVPGAVGGGDRQTTVVAVDRQGRASPVPGLPPASYRDVRASPDGSRLALATQDDVWIYEFKRATPSRLTTDPAQDVSPLWTSDSQRIVFTTRRAGYPELFWQPADGTGRDERLLTRTKDLLDLQADAWSADGKHLLFTEVSTHMAIGQMAVDRPSDAKMLVKSAFRNDHAAISPDGRWLAYTSSVSGRSEVYVERYPELGNRQRISTEGGRIPVWSPDGRELFFSTPDSQQILAVRTQTGTTVTAGPSQVLFTVPMAVFPGGRPFDLATDGRFFIIRSSQAEASGVTASNMILVQNWFEELKRLVPTS